MPSSHSQIEVIVADFESALARVRRLALDLPEETWEKHNDPTSWSVAECVEHLNMASNAYIPVIRAGLEKAPPRSKDDRTFRRDFVGGLLGAMTGRMRRIGKLKIGKMPTTTEFTPSGRVSGDQLVREFEDCQRILVGLAKVSRTLGIDKVKIVSPFNTKVRYNIFSALVIVAVHQHRHLDQADSVWNSGVRPASH